MKIGIIGLGFVGSALKNAYDVHQIETVCRDPDKGFLSTIDEVKNTDGIFISVPSPQNSDGSCNVTILENVLKDLMFVINFLTVCCEEVFYLVNIVPFVGVFIDRI
jgi:UDP-glucose 6-dehydrogenase